MGRRTSIGTLRRPGGLLGVGFWKEILKESSWIRENWKFRIGTGTRIIFWTNPWCGSSILSPTFPDLFKVAVKKHETLAEVWGHLVGNGSWNLNFERAFNDWEMEMVGNLLSALQKEMVTSELDMVSWLGAAGEILHA